MGLFSERRLQAIEKIEHIEEVMGKEKLLDEIIMGLSLTELEETVDWISRHHEITFEHLEEEFVG